MTRRCFSVALAVAEPVPASIETPEGPSVAEGDMYRYLHRQERGRPEQEFLPVEPVAAALCAWRGGAPG